MLNFDPATTNEPLKRSLPNLAYVIVMDISHQEKNGVNPLRGFVSPFRAYAKYTPPMFATPRMFTTFFGSSFE